MPVATIMQREHAVWRALGVTRESVRRFLYEIAKNGPTEPMLPYIQGTTATEFKAIIGKVRFSIGNSVSK